MADHDDAEDLPGYTFGPGYNEITGERFMGTNCDGGAVEDETCAVPEALRAAQRQKLRLVAQKLQREPGMTVREIGCGWGGLAVDRAQEHGVHVVGITISQQQLRAARQRAEDAGVESLWTVEHVIFADDYEPLYPYSETGEAPAAPDTVMPTVVVTNANGTILFSDQADNYRVRPEPDIFLAILRRAGVGAT